MGEVKITIVADDESGQVLDGTVQRLEEVSAAGERVARSSEVVQRSTRFLSGALVSAHSIMTRVELAHLTLEGAQRRVEEAQHDLTRATLEHGTTSEQARNAAVAYESAQRSLEKTLVRVRAAQALVVLETVSFVTQIPRAVQGVTAAARALGQMGAASIALRAGLVGVAIGAGLAIYNVLRTDEATKKARVSNDEYNTSLVTTIALREEMNKAGDEFRQQQEVLSLDFNFGRGISAAAEEGVESLRKLRAELAIMRDDFERHLAGGLTGTVGEAFQRRFQALQAAIDQIDVLIPQKIGAAEAASKQATDQLMQNINQSVQRGLQSMGVSLDQFSPALLAAIPNLGSTVAELANQEQRFTAIALASSKALRDQAEITKYKDETTEQFTKRLRELGFTEEEVTTRINKTGDALLSQAEATKRDEERFDSLLGDKANAQTGAAGGAGSTFGARTLSQIVRFRKSSVGVENIYEEVQEYLRLNPDKATNPEVRRRIDQFIRLFSAMARGSKMAVSPEQMALTLQRKIFAAEHGANFIARQPQLLMVGERGPERVQVDPAPRSGTAASTVVHMGGINVTVHGGDPRAVRQAVRDGIDQGASILQRRLATRGTL